MSDVAGQCDIYKRATRSFVSWLTREVSETRLKAALRDKISVAAIADAAAAVASRGVHAPAYVLADLDTCIRVRREVGSLHARRDAGSDPKHMHFVDVLVLARNALCSAGATGASPSAGAPAGASPFASAASAPKNTSPSIHPAALRTTFAGLTVEEPAVFPECAPQPLDPVEAQQDLMGESLEFEATCFLLDLQALLRDAEAMWGEYREGDCSLLAATAMTNACVQHAERLSSCLELRCPALSTLESIVSATFLWDAVSLVQCEASVGYMTALKAVSEVAFGDSNNGTTLSRYLDVCTGGWRPLIFGAELFLFVNGTQWKQKGQGNEW